MSRKFTGDQKLRIVLECLLRGVPKEEQCRKYGVDPVEFDGWHDLLIKNGGEIFDQPQVPKRLVKTRKVHRAPWYLKLLLTLSLLINLSVAIVFFVWKFSNPLDSDASLSGLFSTVSDPEGKKDSNLSGATRSSVTVPPLQELIEEVESIGIAQSEESSSKTETSAGSTDFSTLSGPAITLPLNSEGGDLASSVEFLGSPYEAKHVVYLLDVGTYQFNDADGPKRLEEMKLGVLESLTKLSPNSYFNLVLCWNLREAHALGKTILRANDENKRYAAEWLASLGTSPETLKEGRNQFYPKELLYANPLPGIVGPWYGLATAISYDPDLIFFLAGNMPAFSPDEVPAGDFEGLRMKEKSVTADGKSRIIPNELDSMIRTTARHWLVSLQSDKRLPKDQSELEEIALKRLGLDLTNAPNSSRQVSIPWEQAFENFLDGLELVNSKIPRVFLFQVLPEHVVWPSALQASMAEFCESTRGNLSLFP